MAVMPIYGKTFKQLLLQNHCANKADILHEAYGAPSCIKQLKSFRSDHKRPCVCVCVCVAGGGGGGGGRKVGKNDAKFRIHEPFELESKFFVGI